MITKEEIRKMSWRKVGELFIEIAESALKKAKNWRSRPTGEVDYWGEKEYTQRPPMKKFEADVEKSLGLARGDCVMCTKHGNKRVEFCSKCKTCAVKVPCRIHDIVVNCNDKPADKSERDDYEALIVMCKEYFQRHLK